MGQVTTGDVLVFASVETAKRIVPHDRFDLVGPRIGRVSSRFLLCDETTKRLLDVVGALLILTIMSPLLLVVGALVKATSPGPVFFRQARYGRHGEIFSIYKFRTMSGAPRDVSAIGDARDHAARMTPIGDFLRRYCIDELPQLLNVLSGQMSLVGPRAHPVGLHVLGALYEAVVPHYHERHDVRPGMTGLAQVRGCCGIVDTIEHARLRVENDILYIAVRSLALDVTLIAFTGWRFLMRGGRGDAPFPIEWFVANQDPPAMEPIAG